MIKKVENIYCLAFLDTLGNHGQRKKNNRAASNLHTWVSAILILNGSPLNAAMLNKRITKNDAHTLKLISLPRLKNSALH